MNRKTNWFAVLASLCLVHSFFGIDVCHAQPNAPTKPNATSKIDTTQPQRKEPQGRKPTKPGEFYKRSTTAFKSNDLVQIPNLREVPQYTGSNVVFGWGEEYPNASGGKVIAYTFSTSDLQNTVIQWYQQYLTRIGWTIEAKPAEYTDDTGAISAHKGRSVCQISTEPDDDNRIQVRVHYHDAPN
ncbi:MAG: hypothetical protein K2Y22_13875 [Candidatus Obscuribacterales bacterium]|nr:hypothetical protein [Candidatus Obscuribacterales bacterium]